MLFQQQLYVPPAQERADPKRIVRRCLKATHSVCTFKVDDPKRDMILIHELSQCILIEFFNFFSCIFFPFFNSFSYSILAGIAGIIIDLK